MTKFVFIVLPLIILIGYSNGLAADYYICKDCPAGDCVQTGSSAGSGCTDWNNAMNDFPANGGNFSEDQLHWIRGATYWIAGSDTAYLGATLRHETGSGTITLKKATATDHGTETGWSAAYGTKQAVMSGVYGYFEATTDVTVTGNGQANGIKIIGGVGANSHNIWARNKWTLLYLELDSPNTPIQQNCVATNYCTHSGIYAFGVSDLTVDHCYIHDIAVPLLIGGLTDTIISNNIIARNDSEATYHSEAISVNGATNLVINNNIFIDHEGTAVIATMNGGAINGAKIYNNLTYSSEGYSGGTGNGWYTCTNEGTVCSDVEIYSNTIVNHKNAIIDIGTGGKALNWTVKNNLWWCDDKCSTNPNETSDNITYENNWYGGVTFNAGENGAINGGAENPFALSSSYDFSLSSISAGPVDKGSALGSGFATDILGTTRPKGSAWDIGAYEYNPSTAFKQSLSGGSLGGGAMR